MNKPSPLTALLKAIELCDGKTQTALGLKIGKPQATVSAWVNRFMCVGVDSVLKVSEATNWQVTPHELRPDIYPHPHDGLPENLRSAA